mmetsp:Transcript_14569/g.37068  ORF Transcript_14569/g.37068 Transcript_14569/m.37068 type:complete len:305 (+) Transcript_14569:58-972(+)
MVEDKSPGIARRILRGRLPPRLRPAMVSPSLACRLLPSSDVFELLWYLLACFLQELYKRWGPFVFRRPQGQGTPCLATTAGAPDAVDEVLHGDAGGLAVEAEVVDDDERDPGDVETASRDVRGHEHSLLSTCHPGAELAKHLLTLPLLFVAMDGPAPHSFERLPHLLLQKVACTLGCGENYGAFVRAETLLEVVLQCPNLLLELGHDHLLCDTLVQSELVPFGAALTDANLDSRRTREGGGDGLHLLGPGRREEQRLPLGATTSSAGTSALFRRTRLWAPLDDLTDGGFEAHIEHLVRLVENEI